MKDDDKTKNQLIDELAQLRQRVAELETAETERERAEEELRGERNKLQAVVEAMEYGLTIQDRDYNITYQNKILEKTFGRVGEKCYRVYEGKDKVCDGCPVEIAYRDGRSHTSERKIVMPSGEIAFWENTANPIRDASGKVVACLEIARNITQRKQAEEELRRHRDQLEELVEERTAKLTESNEQLQRQVTERKQAEEEVRRSRDFLDHILNGMHEGVAVVDRDFAIVEVNECFLRQYGVSREDVIGHPCYVVTHKRDKACSSTQHTCPLKEVFANGKQVRLEHIHADSSGNELVVKLCAFPLFSEDGNVEYMVEMTDDITQRKQAEEALRESEEKYRQLVNTSVDGIITVDSEVKIVLWNPAATRLLGYTEQEMLGQTLMKIVPERYREAKDRGFARFKKTGSGPVIGQTLELSALRKDGTEIPIELSVSSRKVGSTFIATAIVRDITERKRAEEALRESEEKWRSLVENAPDVIFNIDPDGKILFINRTVSGLPVEEVIGTTVYDYVPPEHLDDMKNNLERVFKKGEVIKYEIAGPGPDGAASWYMTTVGPIKKEGKVIAATMVSRNITERKRAEEGREKLLHDMKERVKELQCLYGVARSLRERATLEEIFQDTAALIPTGWHYPEITRANVCFDGEEFAAAPFEETEWKLSADLVVAGERRGSLDVFYMEERPELDEGPFLTEERNLIDGIAHALGEAIERKRAEDELDTVARLGVRLAAADTLESMMTIVREETDHVFRWDAHYFAVRRAEEKDFHVASLSDMVDGEKKTFRRKDWSASKLLPPINRVMQGQPVLVNRAPEDVQPVLSRFGDKNRVSASLMHVPVRSANDIIGILSVQSYTHDRYNEADLQTLQRIADAIAPALERVHAAEALRESEERFRSLVETTSDWIWEVDQNGIYTYASPKIKDQLGYEPEEVIGKTPFDLMPPDEAERVGKIFQSIAESRKPFVALENTNLHVDGRRIVLETSAVPIFDAGGTFLGYRGIDRDITKRKKAEEALRLHSEITANMSQGVYLIRASDGVILYTNPKFGEIFGYSPGEMVGKHVSVVNAPTEKSPEETANEIMEFIDKNGFWRGEIQNIKKDGTPFWCDASVSTFEHLEHGRVLLSVHTDITERKEAEEEKRQLQEQLAQAQKIEALATLTGGIAHEFNNINAAIVGYTELTLDREELSEKARHNLEIIHSSAARGADLTRSLLTFSGKEVAEKRPVNLRNLVADVLKVTERQFMSEGIELIVEHSTVAPRVLGNASMLESVVMNLVVNAKHAMLESETKKLHVQTGLEKGRAFIRVKDTGCGIPKEDVQRVFEPFFTTKGAIVSGGAYDGKIHGTGLGLSVSHGIIENHGGEIKVRSKVGKGTVFTVYLPAASKRTTTPPPVEEGREEGVSRIMVVDDEEAITELLVDILGHAGYEADGFGNPVEALKALRQGQYSLAFIDLQMPQMQGEEFMVEINRLPAEKRPLKVILTGRVGVSEKDYARLDVFGSLPKPFSPEQVVKTVEKGLAKRDMSES